ncbi:hypothetical protein HLRTI_002030 [Halorhabdus tiamatea SARL4B]|uniref:Halobacterial output domain-containing protein n=1 Tax=Halorhabdus tiamatea SARL4B TaxID=1033806 RepID=F7PKI7_9EURY|nr:HalOD1 output domain-containing protein [Halorhabdus tiamatea]ERJ05997.1 hypothetical protein HLRTI_002030 [Halorhabdus tiamatea SARL4B]CCQ33971.1 conserved hypothetical protein [Halorhabdus tiamatea SARL4B]
MTSEEHYVIPGSAGDEWVRPQPVDELVVDAVLDATDYEADELDPLSSYVDLDELVAVFADETDATDLSFTVEDHDVTVHHTGDIDVESHS